MDAASISSLSSLVAVLATLLPVAAILFIWIRTRSLHFPLNRLWQLILGTQEIQDPKIKKLVADQNDLMRFRLAFGINVGSMRKCHQLHDWAKAHDVEMQEIGACGPLFDLQQIGLKEKLPSSAARRFLVFLSLAVLGIAIVLMFLMESERALVKFKDTGRWFLLDANSAQTLFPLRAPRVTSEACRQGASVALGTSFSQRELEIICKAFEEDVRNSSITSASNDKSLSVFIKEALRSQRVPLGSLLILIVFGGALILRGLLSIDAAEKLRGHLSRDTLSIAVEGSGALDLFRAGAS